jgi:hypothetical protein
MAGLLQAQGERIYRAKGVLNMQVLLLLLLRCCSAAIAFGVCFHLLRVYRTEGC